MNKPHLNSSNLPHIIISFPNFQKSFEFLKTISFTIYNLNIMSIRLEMVSIIYKYKMSWPMQAIAMPFHSSLLGLWSLIRYSPMRWPERYDNKHPIVGRFCCPSKSVKQLGNWTLVKKNGCDFFKFHSQSLLQQQSGRRLSSEAVLELVWQQISRKIFVLFSEENHE